MNKDNQVKKIIIETGKASEVVIEDNGDVKINHYTDNTKSKLVENWTSGWSKDDGN